MRPRILAMNPDSYATATYFDAPARSIPTTIFKGISDEGFESTASQLAALRTSRMGGGHVSFQNRNKMGHGELAAFYLMFPVGIVVFAVGPALKSGQLSDAILYGLLFGAIAYATYDLTNYATLKNWSLGITVLDIVYGAIASAAAATVAVLAVRAATGWFGAAN